MNCAGADAAQTMRPECCSVSAPNTGMFIGPIRTLPAIRRVFRTWHVVRRDCIAHNKSRGLFAQYIANDLFMGFGNRLFEYRVFFYGRLIEPVIYCSQSALTENSAELINILDWCSPVVTMFALLSMNNDGYTVRIVCVC